MSKLSDVPSELINQAVCDLEKIEANPKYEVNMGVWHKPIIRWQDNAPTEPKCLVCLAGAVIACELGVLPHEYANIYTHCSREEAQKLSALDDLRNGSIYMGLRALGVDELVIDEVNTVIMKPIQLSTGWTHYENNPIEFKNQLRAIATKLKELGS